MRSEVKHFVLDTNVLLHDPGSIFNFQENTVYIPIDVLEELDHFKTDLSEKGRNSRMVIRALDELRRNGDILQGVEVNDLGGRLCILIDFECDLPKGLQTANTDNRIIMAARYLRDKRGANAVFVSMDINARVKAEALSIAAEDYQHEKVDFNELYTGVFKTEETFKECGLSEQFEREFYANQMMIRGGFLEGKYDPARDNIIRPRYNNTSPWGISALNIEQECALELLMDDSVQLVSLVGRAGTGKTLLALAAGLHKVTEEQKYKKVLIMRPIMPVGKDIGYLPGSKENKLENWMEPVFDNLDFLIDCNDLGKKNRLYFMDSEIIELEALTFIRGRSISSQFIIIDEAQNLTPHEVKTIVSRAGSNSKIILNGDPYQIDNPYLDEASNGLTYLIERFKGQEIYGHVTLEKSERSRLASLAAKIL